ncbi:hypothetical protein C1645_828522 [Glomus cerebriforme]|uniref:Uncharacterized protein n=1 Tax=Glomus cerebriforme TaxID=658196 RepID=A0A397SQM5_9GLOM|nr:hypothetical protein C1645_828522 [Glomus cerebriforme]
MATVELDESSLPDDDNIIWPTLRPSPIIPQECHTIDPPPIAVVSSNSSPGPSKSKKSIQPGRNRKTQKSKAAELRHAYTALQLHIKNLFTYPCSPLISMLNASVGHTHKRNFTSELIEESIWLDRLPLYDWYKLAETYSNALSSILMDWQDNFHAHISNSLVNTLS